MPQLADTHVHLLAGLDDGPRDPEEVAAMCRMLVSEGVRHATALAHQNDTYPANTADRLRSAAADLTNQLRRDEIPLTVYPTAEVVVTADLLTDWDAGLVLSVGDHGKFLLVEMPHGVFLDLRPIAAKLRVKGRRLIVAHAERYPELLHDAGLVEGFIASGCLIQVTASVLAAPPSTRDERALKDWARRGIIHLLGSDGHRMGKREPRMLGGYETLARWAGAEAADRAGWILGSAVLQGLTVNVPPPAPQSRSWFKKLFS